MGLNLDGVGGRNRGEGQRRAFGDRAGWQAIEIEGEASQSGCVIRRDALRFGQRQCPIGRRSFDEQINRRIFGAATSTTTRSTRSGRLAVHGANGETVVCARRAPSGTRRGTRASAVTSCGSSAPALPESVR